MQATWVMRESRLFLHTGAVTYCIWAIISIIFFKNYTTRRPKIAEFWHKMRPKMHQIYKIQLDLSFKTSAVDCSTGRFSEFLPWRVGWHWLQIYKISARGTTFLQNWGIIGDWMQSFEGFLQDFQPENGRMWMWQQWPRSKFPGK